MRRNILNNHTLYNKKTLSPITPLMSENVRANYLKTISINIVQNDYAKFDLTLELCETITNSSKTEIKKELRDIGKTLGIFKEYGNIGDTDLIASFSIRGLYESISNSDNVSHMYFIVYNMEQVINKLVKIEEHFDNKNDRNVESTHELLCLLHTRDNNYVLVKATIKKIISPNQHNNIYSLSNFELINLNKKKGSADHQTFDCFQTLDALHPLSTYKLTNLIPFVNSPDVLRYIPDELLSEEQISIKYIALEKYKIKKKGQIEKKEI